MTTAKDIFDQLCVLAPPGLQMPFDNSGFLLGRRDAPVQRVLLALDITDWVIREAEELPVQMIISHHPLIWDGLKAVTESGAGGKVLRLAESGIAAASMHTNLDIAQGGVNDVLIRLLGAEPEEALDDAGCGRIGRLPEPVPLAEFLAVCRQRLNVKGLRYVDAGKKVSRLGVLGGAGGDEMHFALQKGCDTYVTADIKYHQFLDAAEQGLNLIDADHFCTEHPVIPVVAEKLRAAFPDVEFIVSKTHRQVVSFA